MQQESTIHSTNSAVFSGYSGNVGSNSNSAFSASSGNFSSNDRNPFNPFAHQPSKTTKKPAKSSLDVLKERLDGSDNKVPLSDQDLHLEMPGILSEKFGMTDGASQNIFSSTNPATVKAVKEVFGARGSWLRRARVNQVEGFTINVQVHQLLAWMAKKVQSMPTHAFPPALQRIISPPHHLTCRALDYFFLLFALKAIMCKENEPLTSVRRSYMGLLQDLFNYYMPTSNSTSKISPGSTSTSPTKMALAKLKSEAMHGFEYLQSQGINAFNHSKQKAANTSEVYCSNVKETELFVSILLEVWAGSFIPWGPPQPHMENTHAVCLNALIRWILKSIYYHKHAIKSTSMDPKQMELLHARLNALENVYNYYKPYLFKCVVSNADAQEKIYCQAVNIAYKLLNPWYYYVPKNSTPTKQEFLSYIRENIAYYICMPYYIIANIPDHDFSYTDKKSRGLLDHLQMFLELFGLIIDATPRTTLKDVVQDFEEGFQKHEEAYFQSLITAMNKIGCVYKPMFVRDEEDVSEREADIVDAYKHLQKAVKAGKNRLLEQKQREITPMRLLRDLSGVIAQLYIPAPQEVDITKYKKYVQSIEKLRATFDSVLEPHTNAFPDGSSEVPSLVKGNVNFDRSALQQGIIKNYAHLRMQPVRSYEIGALVWATHKLAQYLNNQFAPRPWMKDGLSKREIVLKLRHRYLNHDGMFFICPSENYSQMHTSTKAQLFSDEDDESDGGDQDGGYRDKGKERIKSSKGYSWLKFWKKDEPKTQNNTQGKPMFYIAVVRDKSVETDTLIRIGDAISLDGQTFFADVDDFVSYYKECPYYIGPSNEAYKLAFVEDDEEKEEDADEEQTLGEHSSKKKKSQIAIALRSLIMRMAPFNLRFLADKRLWMWIFAIMFVLLASGSATTTLLLFIFIILLLLAISFVSSASD